MKIDNKKCFSCIAKHICGPTVTPKMAMCINFLKSMEALKPSHNKQSTPLCDTYLDAGGQRRCSAGFVKVST